MLGTAWSVLTSCGTLTKGDVVDADTEKLIREMWSDFSTAQRNLEARLLRRFDGLEQRFDRLEQRVEKLEAELATFRRVVVENFARVRRNFELLLAEVRDPAHKARLDKIEERLSRLELHVALPPED
jgi:hypothetical protein